MNKSEPKSRAMTFRIAESIANELENEANAKKISLNTLANQILANYVEWYSNAAKAGYVSVRRSFITRVLSKFTEEEIAEISREVAKDTMDISLVLRRKFNVSSTLEIIESKIKNSGFHLRRDVRGNEHTLVIQHDLGRKWSVYLARLFEAEFDLLKAKKPHLIISDNALVLKAEVEDVSR
jgi:hypothetical protein